VFDPTSASGAESAAAQSADEFLARALKHFASGKCDHLGVFSEPVSDDVAPGYSSVIKVPMSFSAMQAKLRAGAYATLGAFAADLRLIVTNATTYNAPNSQVHKAALELQTAMFAYLRRHTASLSPAFVGTDVEELAGAPVRSSHATPASAQRAVKLQLDDDAPGDKSAALAAAAGPPPPPPPPKVWGGVASQFVVHAAGQRVRDAVHSSGLVDLYLLADYDPYRFADYDEPSTVPAPQKRRSTLREAIDSLPTAVRDESLRALAAIRTGAAPPPPFAAQAVARVRKALAPPPFSPDDMRRLAASGVDMSAVDALLSSTLDADLTAALRRACSSVVQLAIARQSEPDASKHSDALAALLADVERDVARAVERVGDALPVRVDTSLVQAQLGSKSSSSGSQPPVNPQP
jgi:hypothetical protein